MKESKTEQTRSQILKVANLLFQKFGFEKTSMEDIALAAHKAKRSLYNHFTDKEDLFNSVASEELEQIWTQLHPVLENVELAPLVRLRHYLHKRFDVIANSGLYHVILENVSLRTFPDCFHTLNKKFLEFEHWEHTQFVSLWHEGVEDEKLPAESEPQAEAFADMAQMLLKSLDYTFFVKDKYADYKETYVYLVNLIINGLNK